MILTSFVSTAYRVHDPKWSFAPVSGAGAARYGGRANRPGVNALYLSVELETAIAEYKRLDALMPPALIVGYDVKVEPVVDFRGGYTGAWDLIWQDFNCDWRRMVFNDKVEPPSWAIGDMVLAAGAKGILFDSVIADGTNLVLYNDTLEATDVVRVYDPNHALPRDQSSWR